MAIANTFRSADPVSEQASVSMASLRMAWHSLDSLGVKNLLLETQEEPVCSGLLYEAVRIISPVRSSSMLSWECRA